MWLPSEQRIIRGVDKQLLFFTFQFVPIVFEIGSGLFGQIFQLELFKRLNRKGIQLFIVPIALLKHVEQPPFGTVHLPPAIAQGLNSLLLFGFCHTSPRICDSETSAFILLEQ